MDEHLFKKFEMAIGSVISKDKEIQELEFEVSNLKQMNTLLREVNRDLLNILHTLKGAK